jgi:nicotinamidase-related amidase
MKSKEELEKLLIVVDMVNGFVREGVMSSKNIEHIIPRIEQLVKKAKEREEGVVFIKDTHNPDSLEFKKFPPHCLKGTSESELVSELKPYEGESMVYEKNSTSTMFAPGFMNDIEKMKKLREVIVTGCCTDICVLNLVIPLTNYFDQNNRDVRVSVYEDAIETYDAPNHSAEEYNQMSLKLMRQAGINIL